MRLPAVACAVLGVIGCAHSPPPQAAGFQPFAGGRTARVKLRATDKQGVRSARGLVERLALLGVDATVLSASAERVVLRIARVREPEALVRAVARPDWWRFELVEPEPEPPRAEPPADPDRPFSAQVFVQVTPVETTMEPQHPRGGRPSGRALLASTDRVRAFIIPAALRDELKQSPRVALEDAEHRDDPAWMAATREPRLAVEATPEVAHRLRQWTSENVGRPLALVVGSEILLLSPVHNGERLELTLRDRARTEDASIRLGEALVRLLAARAEVGTLVLE